VVRPIDYLAKAKEDREVFADIRKIRDIELNLLIYGSQLGGDLVCDPQTVMRQLVKTVYFRAVVLRPLAARHNGNAFLHTTSVQNRTENPCRKQHGKDQK
jgi:hypothetical protein